MPLPCFPPAIPHPTPPSLHRVRAGYVPRLHHYYEVLRLPAAHPALLRCLRSAVPSPRRSFAPTGPGAIRRPGGFGCGTPSTPLLLTDGDGRISQVPGEPLCAYALALDPGRTDATGHTSSPARPPHQRTARAPAMMRLSRLNPTALALAVYASPPGLPTVDARLASRSWPVYGAGLVTR